MPKGLNLLTETWAWSLDLPRSLSLCRISVTGPPRHVTRKRGSCPLPLLAEGEHCYRVGGAGQLLHTGLKITSIFKAEEESLQAQRRRRLPRDRSSRLLLPNSFPSLFGGSDGLMQLSKLSVNTLKTHPSFMLRTGRNSGHATIKNSFIKKKATCLLSQKNKKTKQLYTHTHTQSPLCFPVRLKHLWKLV